MNRRLLMRTIGRAGALCGVVFAMSLAVGGCAADHSRAPTQAILVMRRDDVQWLERVSFGLDTSTVATYRRLGRERYLNEQLHPGEDSLPAAVQAQIDALDVSHLDVAQRLGAVETQRKSINALADGPEREQARKSLNDQGNRLANQAVRRDLLRAIYSPNQLREQMVWFWLNHFSVFQGKADLRWLIADYEEQAIRPHALGHFKDLVMATLEHPAMLEYLDNARNAAGHVNENYARELMELHTLGVDGGYSQQDVQTMARVLTGVGVNPGDAPRLKPALKPLYLRSGVFEFNPARHDAEAKILFGKPVSGEGFGEVEAAVNLIVNQPACARFISRQLALYFVADTPPSALVDHMAQTFLHTDGDIAAVLRTMFLSKEFAASAGQKFKDPMRFVVSSVRLAYDDRAISNTRPIVNWLNGLGEASYGHQTPDGYSLMEVSWASSGQMSRRFEIARSIGAGNAGLFDAEDSGPAPSTGFPQIANRLYYEAVEPFLSAGTRAALARSNSQQEWNTFLLSSPEFAYE